MDLKYLAAYDHLNFNYFIYEIEADCKEIAVTKARDNYMKGIEPLFSEELPFLLKLFSVEQKNS